ncbi:MAG: dipeptide epimerase [Caulobacteraceae bacterium]
MKLTVELERWAYRAPLHITGHVFTEAQVLMAVTTEGRFTGLGEAGGGYYRPETPDGMASEIEAVRDRLEAGIDRESLRSQLAPGGARNAVDAALWDLESKRSGRPVWQLADLGAPRALRTTLTVGAGEPEAMAARARDYVQARAIKVKLTGEDDEARLRAVRKARPDVWLGVDANQGFTLQSLQALIPVLLEMEVRLIEQPLPVGKDADLKGLDCSIPLAADESVQGFSDLAGLDERYDVINIKLDKCGGLTEGLAMAREVRRMGLKPMAGCMTGTSLSIAPAFVLGQICELVDLDGPVMLAKDREPAAKYEDGNVWCPPSVWGCPS